MATIATPEDFTKEFINEYLGRGFGTLSKRDIDVLVLHLLIKYKYFGDEFDYFKASKLLKISEARVRSIYSDVQLRYEQYTENEAKSMFIELFESMRFERTKTGKYRFIVRDPLLRQYFEEWVASVNGFHDSSFNPNLVVVSRDVLEQVMGVLAVDKSLNDIKAEMPKEINNEIGKEGTIKGYIKRFLDSYVDTLGTEAAKGTTKAVGLGFRALLGIPF
jgi:hypothetical protein